MAKEVKVPKISEGVESATVAEVLVSEGDTIKEEQSIIAVETDKASVEVPSSDGGKVKEIKVKEGDEIKVGDVILTLEEEGGEEKEEEEEGGEEKAEKESKEEKKERKEAKKEEKKADEDEEEKVKEEEEKADEEKKKEKEGDKEETEEEKEKKEEAEAEKEKDGEEEAEEDETEAKKKKKEKKAKKEKKEEETEEKEKPEKEEEKGEEVPASPAVRRLAREMGVDIQALDGSGPGGRITEADVKSATKKKAEGEEGGGAPTQPSLPDFSQWGQVERQPLSGIRKATAKNTLSSWQTIPHVTQFDEADISGIEEYMEKMQGKAEEAGGKLTITAILLKIAANALQQFPKFNASIDMRNEEVILKKYIHIGMAVDTEKGLLLPVIRDVNKKSIIDLSVEITQLAEKARQGELSPEEMKGGNFSISNLGGIGGTNFTPVVYHPQVAILGISRTDTRPVFSNGKFEPRQILPLSLSYDHRLIDGAEGARFLKWISQALEDPYKALLGA